MADPFIGEIKLVAFQFAPKSWAFCNGQLLPIQQNQALFSLLGTQYGGNGTTTFALPDLRGRAAMHMGPNTPPGASGGQERVALNASQMPAHSHALAGTAEVANANVPTGALPAAKPRGGINRYAGSANTTLHAASVGIAGSGQPHENMQPFLVMNYVIALSGIFPSRS